MTDEAIKQELAYLRTKMDQAAESMHNIDKRLVVIETRAAIIAAVAGVIVSVVIALIG